MRIDSFIVLVAFDTDLNLLKKTQSQQKKAKQSIKTTLDMIYGYFPQLLLDYFKPRSVMKIAKVSN